MPEVSKDLIILLQYLVPGFLVAWICFGMTSHQKPSQFERVVQALIYALFVHFFVNGERAISLWAGKWWNFGVWNGEGELFASLVTAIVLGFFLSYLLNSDRLHEFFREHNFSTRSSHPSEWCTAFEKNKKWIIIHFKDERRLYGWPGIWPSDPTKGHVLVSNALWIRDEEAAAESNTDEAESEQEKLVLVDVVDVKWIEFIEQN
jgi:hypothetical protein